MIVVRVVAGVAALAWVWLAVCQGGFWRTDVRLPPRRQPAKWPSVAIVVPARDEAAVLPRTLPSLLAQRYPGSARVILVDDGSTDGTGAVAAGLARARNTLLIRPKVGGHGPQPIRSQTPVSAVAAVGSVTNDSVPMTVTSPGPVPVGWAGKLWAVAHGVEVAGEVEWLLLTDADIAHSPDSLVSLVEAAGERDLVSQMALLRTETGWERLIVPAFVYFFAMLYPFRRVNRPSSRTAAAAGGCCLVRRTALERAGGVAAIRGAVIDDVALGRAVKRSGGRVWLGLAEGERSVRPYPTLGSLWRMVSRSAYTQLGHSVLLLAGTVLGLGLVFLAPPVCTVVGACLGDAAVAVTAAFAWVLMTLTFVPMLRYYGQPWWRALCLPLTATLYLLMTVDSAVQHWRGRGATWKGRTYASG